MFFCKEWDKIHPIRKRAMHDLTSDTPRFQRKIRSNTSMGASLPLSFAVARAGVAVPPGDTLGELL